MRDALEEFRVVKAELEEKQRSLLSLKEKEKLLQETVAKLVAEAQERFGVGSLQELQGFIDDRKAKAEELTAAARKILDEAEEE